MKGYSKAQQAYDNRIPDFYYDNLQDAREDGIRDMKKQVIEYLESFESETGNIVEIIEKIERMK